MSSGGGRSTNQASSSHHVTSATAILAQGQPVTLTSSPHKKHQHIFVQKGLTGAVRSTGPSIQVAGTPPRTSGNTNSTVPLVIAAPASQQQQRFPVMRPGYVPFDPDKEVKQFWTKQRDKIDALTTEQLREATKTQLLPLARVKKIMKIDDEVKAQMISAEAPVLFAKACEMFIEELTLRSWVHTEDNKRKTLQKNDVAMAISKYEQFDFLIDIVPREETKPPTNSRRQHDGEPTGSPPAPVVVNDSQLQYIVSVPGGGQQLIQAPALSNLGSAIQQMSSTQVQLQNGQIVQATPVGQPIQLQALPGQTMQLIAAGEGQQSGQPIQLQVLPSGVQIAGQQDLHVAEDAEDDE